MRRRLSSWVECLQERHECSRLRRAQVFSVGWHVAAALDHLTYELILRELHGYSIQFWSALSARAAQRVAVMALLRLKNQRSLPLQSCTTFQVLRWNRFAAPRVHHRAPRRVAGQMREGTECHCHKQNRENRNGAALPAFLAFP